MAFPVVAFHPKCVAPSPYRGRPVTKTGEGNEQAPPVPSLTSSLLFPTLPGFSFPGLTNMLTSACLIGLPLCTARGDPCFWRILHPFQGFFFVVS